MLPRIYTGLALSRRSSSPFRSPSTLINIFLNRAQTGTYKSTSSTLFSCFGFKKSYSTAHKEYKTKISQKFREILEDKVKRWNDIQAQLENSGSLAAKDVQLLNKEVGQLSELIEAIHTYDAKRVELDELNVLIKNSGSEPEMAAMAREDAQGVISTLLEAESTIANYFARPDAADSAAAVIMEIRPAAGGLEAGLFASEMFECYKNYATKIHKWNCEVMSMTASDVGGVKEIVAQITGKNVFKFMKFESGVHRVQRVPETETGGRVHTSTMTVAMLPEAENVELDIKQTDLRIEAYRAGGAGGQHVNKTESAIRITHIPTGITVAIQEDRSQHKNKDRAMKVLKARLWALEREKLQQQRSSARKSQTGTGERHERIRTYNYPQDRITDHRVNETWHGIEDLSTGELLETIHDALLENEQLEYIAEAVEEANASKAPASKK